jgi:thioredoxin reductase (NADPH)
VAAAIQLKRYGVRTLLFEKRAVGGLLLNANRVENYPGIPPGISGPLLCRLLARHLEAVEVEPTIDEITEIERRGRRYELRARSGASYSSDAVLLATGTRPLTGIFAGEEKLGGDRIFYEVWDVLTGAPGKRAAIVGGGDAAYDYALNLASKSFEVVVLQRGRRRCLPLLAERAGASANITVMRGGEIEGCAEKESGLEIAISREGTVRKIEADFLLIACGRSAEDGLLRSLDEEQDTPPPAGLFTGGDLVRGDFRQAGIAVGDGLRAAMAAAGYIDGTGEAD